MSSLTKPRLAAYLAGIFLAGGISGGFLGHGWRSERPRPRERPAPEEMAQLIHRKLSDEVGVTAEQWNSISPIITNLTRAIADLDNQNRERIRELITRSDTAVMEKLTPEQKPRMEKLISERHSHRRRSPEKSPPPP